jgi:hypothetical protein
MSISFSYGRPVSRAAFPGNLCYDWEMNEPEQKKIGATGKRVPVEPVGKPGKAWLELNGTILVYHRDSWIMSSSLYIPVEWTVIQQSRQLDIRSLWRGILGVMVAFLFALPILVILRMLPPLSPWDVALGLGLAALMLLSLGIGLVSLARFIRPRGMTAVRVHVEGSRPEIAFWHAPGKAPELDALIEKIQSLRSRIDEILPYPVRINHLWRRQRPYRIAFVKGCTISFFLYLAFLVLEVIRVSGGIGDYPRSVYLLILAPPIYYLGIELIRAWRGSGEPKAYRDAVRAYGQGQLAEAEAQLDALLKDQPFHNAGLLLMVQVCAEQYVFDKAFNHCAQLSIDQPVLAGRLQASIWEVKRMYDRMED